jgi:type IV pilus biogenesis protein CpaD/CtpE
MTGMSPESPDPAPLRPAAVVNAEIRALLERTRRRLSDAERAEYEGLVEEYEAARRAEITTAA